MMLGKQVEGLNAVVVERVDNLVMGEILNWWKKRKELAFGWSRTLTILVLNPP